MRKVVRQPRANWSPNNKQEVVFPGVRRGRPGSLAFLVPPFSAPTVGQARDRAVAGVDAYDYDTYSGLDLHGSFKNLTP